MIHKVRGRETWVYAYWFGSLVMLGGLVVGDVTVGMAGLAIVAPVAVHAFRKNILREKQ